MRARIDPRFFAWVAATTVVWGIALYALDLHPDSLVSLIAGAVSGWLSPWPMFKQL